MVVSEYPALETYSVGEGADRRVTIAPRGKAAAGAPPTDAPTEG
jgi:hypothetical protein